MGVLGKERIIESLKCEDPMKRLFITPLLSPEQVGEASVDIRIGHSFLTTKRGNIGVFDPKDGDVAPDRFRHRHRLNRGEIFFLHPNEMVLAGTIESFKLPTSIAAYVTSRSKWGRMGLVIATATAIHPGFTGTITLELINHSNVPLALYPGLLIAQIVFTDSQGATHYDGDLAGKTEVHAPKLSGKWQSDMDFWMPKNPN